MSGVPNRGHFYCTSCLFGSDWLIYERRCKAKGIEGGFVYSARSRYHAYQLRNVLEKMYRLGAYDKLKRWCFVFGGKHPFTHNIYLDALAFARQLLAEFAPDDFKVISAPIVSNGG